MDLNETSYFTGSDATIRLLTHPSEEWRGREVDCAFFRLTAGSSPIHIWNYTRREGPAMSNQSQEDRLSELQTDVQSGAPFDDTAISNARFELQLMLNEDRFKTTYYSFRSMTEIGNVQIKYSRQKGWEERAEAGYVLVGGRVGGVGREVNVRDSVYPAINIQFENMYGIQEDRPVYTQEGISNQMTEEEAAGLDPAMSLQYYTGRVDGRVANPDLMEALPSQLSGYDSLERNGTELVEGPPESFIRSQDYRSPVVVITFERQTIVLIWSTEEGRYFTSNAQEPLAEIDRLLEASASVSRSDAPALPQ